MKKEKGITLVALVVTIIVLIILAGISINLLLGDNGLITKAKEAKRQQKIAEIKEKISLELASAETDAIIRNESLEEQQLNDIVSKYGILQDDKDTILTKDDNYEISLKEIWYGTLSTSGSYSDKKKQIEMLEKELKDLQDKYDELEQINSGNSEVLNDLRNQITTLENEKKTLEDSLKAEQDKNKTLEDSLKTEQDKNKTLEAQMADLNSKYDNLKNEYDKFFNDPGTAVAGDILKGKTAWVSGKKITGTKDMSDSGMAIATWQFCTDQSGTFTNNVVYCNNKVASNNNNKITIKKDGKISIYGCCELESDDNGILNVYVNNNAVYTYQASSGARFNLYNRNDIGVKSGDIIYVTTSGGEPGLKINTNSTTIIYQ